MVNMLSAAKDNNVKRFVYASSSSVYGDNDAFLKSETEIGTQLSPYAASKRTCEILANTWSKAYGLSTIGLRYFNVFGPRQNPHGEYAAVIPKWVANVKAGLPLEIYGDGETARDFTPVQNVISANMLAAKSKHQGVYNIGCGQMISLNRLAKELKGEIVYKPYRDGDIKFSCADIKRAVDDLGYKVIYNFEDGLREYLK